MRSSLADIDESGAAPAETTGWNWRGTARWLLGPLASLELTVALLGASVFLVLAGTLAQTEKDIWEVVGQYFRCWFARVDLAIFFPKAWFPKMPQIPGYFWFPGGFQIGTLMGLNLLAAHALRFTVQARGLRLAAGLIALLAGIGVTWLVIASNDNTNGLQGVPSLQWSMMWFLIKVGLALLCPAGFCLFYYLAQDPRRTIERNLVLALTLILTVTVVALFYRGDLALGDSSMRILWQLLQGGFAGVVLLAGCALLFKKRAGIVLLHGGIALMMANELVVAFKHEEAQMRVLEGESVNWVQDIRSVELAVIDRSDPDRDAVTVIPAARLMQPGKISHTDLPFDLQVVKYLRNSDARQVTKDDANLATDGTGKIMFLEERKPGTGVDGEGKVDNPGAYIRFFEKGSDRTLGTYAIALYRSMLRPAIPERVKLGNKTWHVFLRFKRTYKPYSIKLQDVRHDKYVGTNTPRNYSSDILLTDESRNVHDRPIKIWMNNPLRFAGETFYQSQYDVEKVNGQFVEATGLQVVKNSGWMIPYVACMIVAVGMLAQFVVTLVRFLGRREMQAAAEPIFETVSPAPEPIPVEKTRARGGKRAKETPLPEPELARSAGNSAFATLFPAIVVTVVATYLATQIQIPGPTKEGFKLYEFGKLPVVYQGRTKPLDTLARNTLRVISGRESFYIYDAKERATEQPAIRWLADLVADTEDFRDHRVIRIDNPEVLNTLKLKARAGYLYSVNEIQKDMEDFNTRVREARGLKPEQLKAFDRKLLEVDRRIRALSLLVFALREPVLPAFPSEEDFHANPRQAAQQVQAFGSRLMQFVTDAPDQLAEMQAPLAVPVGKSADGKEFVWKPYSLAWAESLRGRLLERKEAPEAVLLWGKMVAAYQNRKGPEFNRAVSEYRAHLDSTLNSAKPEQLDLFKLDFEAYFNNALPFYWGIVCYVLAFVLAVASWLGWRSPLNRASFWLIAFTLGIHTAGIVARMYISGRPPVTNLYSSAVFISWGCVALGLLLEWLYRLGIGNIVAAVTGFAGLVVAHNLAGDGDTFTVLQAVLDTQFWLATHVVSISLGYATTFLAGFLAIMYVLMGIVFPAARRLVGLERAPVRSRGESAPVVDPEFLKLLGTKIYGMLCFAIFFSFVGTVLGGLWADDSWGRFWGWDPKENGALIIVLWNALVLHARWAKLVQDRGLAVLALGGNICTAWSWFGVNELGVGLHSYGFTEGVLLALGVFVASQLALIALGMLPRFAWERK